jgi:hypothetical protein
MRQLSILLFAALSTALAQTTGGITAPASRTVVFEADEAAFTLAVAATLDSTQQQVKQVLANAGLPNPTVVATGLGQDSNAYTSGTVQALYSATITIAAGSAIDTAKRLEELRAHLPAPLQGLQYSVAFNTSQAKVDAMRSMVLPQLMDESRKLAQSLAAAAGLKLGAVRSVSDSGGIGGVALVAIYDPTTGTRFGDFSGFLLGVPGVPSSTGTRVTFSLNVVYATTP